MNWQNFDEIENLKQGSIFYNPLPYTEGNEKIYYLVLEVKEQLSLMCLHTVDDKPTHYYHTYWSPPIDLDYFVSVDQKWKPIYEMYIDLVEGQLKELNVKADAVAAILNVLLYLMNKTINN